MRDEEGTLNAESESEALSSLIPYPSSLLFYGVLGFAPGFPCGFFV